MNLIKKESGLIICIFSLLIYVLLRFPLNNSVVCANENQGFAFTFGNTFLEWGELAPGRGLLFVALYALVIKLFGFNTYSIIAIHVLETVFVLTVGMLLYLVTQNIVKNSFLSGLATLFWILMISTPVGYSNLVVELRSHYNFNEENLCLLFSLFSIYCLQKKHQWFFFFAGVLAICSLMSKANGAVVSIATILWFIQLKFFQKNIFAKLKKNIIYYFFGVLLSLVLFNIIIYLFNPNLIAFWKDYFLLGVYKTNHLASLNSFFHGIFNFMTRHTNSTNNFVLFSLALILFIYGIAKLNTTKNTYLIWSLVGLWGLGNACVIIIPGTYQPYYYHLIWPSIALVFVFGINELFQSNKKIFAFLGAIIFLIIFTHRIFTSIPAHISLTKELNQVSISSQPQSFQDPVLPYDIETYKREGHLKSADAINIFIPKKKDTFYIFNFNKQGVSGFSPLSYIYAKRSSPTSVDCNLLKIKNIAETKLTTLRKDLTNRPPHALVLSKDMIFTDWQKELFKPFLSWFNNFIQDNYTHTGGFNFTHGDKVETFLLFQKNS